jgi:sialidase-1
VLIAGGDGELHFLYCENYARAFYRKSLDDGKTWAPPVEITFVFEHFRPRYPWRVIATGPCHGIQLAGGRLLVPVWLSDASEWPHGPSVVATIFSDDSGNTWHAGSLVPQAEDVYSPSETCAVQLSDGSVLLNMRTHNIKLRDPATHRRAFSVSADGAEGFSVPTLKDALPDPSCCGGITRGSNGAVFLCNLDSVDERQNLVIKQSDDDCETFPVRRTLCRGGTGYSDITAAQDGTLLCFYESFWGPLRYHSLRLARFSPEWLTSELWYEREQNKDAGSETTGQTAALPKQNAVKRVMALLRRLAMIP